MLYSTEAIHLIKKFIMSDDKASIERLNVKFDQIPPELFEYCAEYLSLSCFDYFLSIRDAECAKQDDNFTKLCATKAAAGLRFDDQALWVNSGKRNAQKPPPKEYHLPLWKHSVPESVYLIALKKATDDKDKTKDFVKNLMMHRIPVTDMTYISVNSNPTIQGYVSWINRYLYQEQFGIYASKVRKNAQ